MPLGICTNKLLGPQLTISPKVHPGPLEIESTVLKAHSTILGNLGILNFRHLLNAALRSVNYMAIFMHTFVRGALIFNQTCNVF